LAYVNVTALAAGKRATPANGFRIQPALHGSNGVRFRKDEPYLNHISGFPVGGLESGNGDVIAAGDVAPVQHGAGCVFQGGFFGCHFVGFRGLSGIGEAKAKDRAEKRGKQVVRPSEVFGFVFHPRHPCPHPTP
jgi:hypothetical protein